METINLSDLLKKCSLLVLIVSLVACSSDEPVPMGQPDIQGKVIDDVGGNYDNIEVVLSQANSQAASTSTNPMGLFSFDGLADGEYEVQITPPLASKVQSANPQILSVGGSDVSSAEFTLITEPVSGMVIGSGVDPYGEIKNANGAIPTDQDEKLYAVNVFTDGKLIPILAPDGHHILYGEWQRAQGEALVSCSGKTTKFNLQFTGLIPDGVYTVWVAPMQVNKSSKPSDMLGLGALGDRSGTRNIITADAQGVGELIENMQSGALSNVGTLPSCALTNSEGLALILDYHIDGKTYGATNGPDHTEVGHMIFLF